jgi:hypothetical protein
MSQRPYSGNLGIVLVVRGDPAVTESVRCGMQRLMEAHGGNRKKAADAIGLASAQALMATVDALCMREWVEGRWPERVIYKGKAAKRLPPLANRATPMAKRGPYKRQATLSGLGEKAIQARIEALGSVCAYCGEPWRHIDHVKPFRRGGRNMLSNIRPACVECNSSKGSKDPLVWLRGRPPVSPLPLPG